MKIRKLVSSVVLGAALVAQAAADKPQITIPRQGGTELMLTALSDNGSYAIAVKQGDQDVDNPHPMGGVLYNVATGTTVDIPAPLGFANVTDVTDDGLVVGASGQYPATYDIATRQWTTYAVPAGWDAAQFSAVTPDGRYACGICLDYSDDYHAAPMVYDLTTGEQVALTNLPTVDLNGDPARQNAAYAISPDGRYLVGHVSESFMMPVSMFVYVYDIQQQTWTPIGYNYNAATKRYTCTYPNLHFVDTRYTSCDGQWLCGTAYMVEGTSELEGGSEYYAPYRYNVANGQLEVYTAATDQNVQGDKITADGTLLGCTPAGYQYPTAVVRSGQFFITLDQILGQVYGMSMGDMATGSFQALSADGLTAVMRTYDDCYLIRMPEPFADAAARVDLLANYAPSIPEGSAISSISEIKITFDRAIGAMNLPSQVKLRTAAGTEVRSASAFTVSTTNDHVLVVTFRTTALTPGEQYVIDIPADMVWLKDEPSVKAHAIQLHYTGRADGPVQMLSASPADGSTLASLDPTSRTINLRFDAQVAIAETAVATLYNDDDQSVVAQLYGVAQGQQAIFYPLTTYNLYKGSHYRVDIAAGSVTDLSGAGGCQAITLHYDGAYVRELSADDLYIFNADCDTYDNFMFWQTEFNEPSAIPSSWGFTAETPWVLVRENEESVDQALAAHSMFTPAGRSDDWLVTPQLYIPDANTYLAFDAQRYRNSKADALQVYIYASDAVYNYFSDELCDVFRTDGDLVFDQVIPSGATDEGLDGEWTRYTYDLAPYAGKNIYIAFVNNNYDQSAIFLDDVQVVRNMDFFITNTTPSVVVDQTGLTVGGILSVANEINTYDSVSLRLSAPGSEPQTIGVDGTMAHGDTREFAFAPIAIIPGEETAYTIDVLDGADVASTFVYTVKDLLFEPTKRVILEEYSGSTCGNCPLGIRAIEELERTFGDNFIPVLLRTYDNDMYSTGVTGYSAFLGCEGVGAPSGRVDRGPVTMPSVHTEAGYQFVGQGIMQSNGTEAYLWADAVRDAMSTPAEAAVEFDTQYDGSQITVDCSVTFALNTEGRSLGLFAVVTEDDLFTVQLNYMNTLTDPALGDWGASGMYNTPTVTTWRIDDVARLVISGNAYNGTPLEQSAFTAGEDYDMTLTATVPADRLTDAANCSVVVMLIDGATGRVINANKASLGTSGIADIDTDLDAPVEYYTLQGFKVTNPEPGHVYIRRQGTKTDKILIK